MNSRAQTHRKARRPQLGSSSNLRPPRAATRAAAFRSLGDSLGRGSGSVAAVIERVEAGFPFDAFNAFQRSTKLPAETIAALVQIPSRTLARRKAAGRLRPDESERLLRISRVVDQAVQLFEGDRPAAMQWLQAAQPALGGHTPLEYARTEVGAREVEDVIGRLEHGAFT
jgi:putative toxin-antitoxin system antitoxin component (TIGR02293 family)